MLKAQLDPERLVDSLLLLVAHLDERSFDSLPKDSIVNVSQLLTLDRSILSEPIARIPGPQMSYVDEGLRLVMAL